MLSGHGSSVRRVKRLPKAQRPAPASSEVPQHPAGHSRHVVLSHSLACHSLAHPGQTIGWAVQAQPPRCVPFDIFRRPMQIEIGEAFDEQLSAYPAIVAVNASPPNADDYGVPGIPRVGLPKEN